MSEFMPLVEKVLEKEEFTLGDRVIYTDPKGNEKKGEVTKSEGDLHLGEGLVEIKFDDGSVEGVSVEDLKIIKESEDTEILE